MHLRIQYGIKRNVETLYITSLHNFWENPTTQNLLRASQSLLVVEAKKDDITRGFTQMAVELIALSQIESQPFQYGAVTMGDVWRFGLLDVEAKRITEDIKIYSLPDDLESLMLTLVGIVEGNPLSNVE